MLCSGTRGMKPSTGLVLAAPLGLCSLLQQGLEHPRDCAPWVPMHPEDQSTPGTGEPWGPVHPGDLSTLGTRASRGLVYPRDWSTLGITQGLLSLLPAAQAAPGVAGDTIPRDAPETWAAHTLAAALSWSSIRDSPSPSPNYCQRARKASRPLPHAANCRDVAMRKRRGCLPVPGARAGLQRLQSQRSRARHQPGQALCSPAEGGQRHG